MKTILSYIKILLEFIKWKLKILSSAYYYCAIAKHHFDLGKFKYSLKYFLESENLKLPTQNNLSLFNWTYIGYTYLYLGNNKKAVEHFEKVFTTEKNDAYLVYSIAKCYDLLGDTENAIYYYNYGLELNEEAVWHPLEAAVMFISHDQKDEAGKYINIAQRRAQTEIESLIVNAWKLHINDEYSEALEQLKKAIDLINLRKNKIYWEQRINIITYYYNILTNSANEDYPLTYLEELFVKFKKEPILNAILAQEYLKRNTKLGRALNMVDFSLKYEPYNSTYHIVKGKILNKMNKVEKALASFETALQYDPGNSEAQQYIEQVSKM